MSKFLKVLAAIVLCLGLIGSFILATLISFGLLYGFGEVLDKLDEIIGWQKVKKD